MAIGTDAAIHVFGTEDSLASTTSAVTDNSFSDGTNDLVAWTNDDDAPEAVAVLTWQYPSGTLDAQPHFILHAQRIDIDGTVDEPVPDATNTTQQIGTWFVDPGQAVTTDSSHAILIALENTKTSQVYHFYVENQTGVSMSAGWDVSITPRTLAPHP